MYYTYLTTLVLLFHAVHTYKQPNIIYILADDLGYGDVGFAGGNVQTPNLNKLASQGVLLRQHYVQPMCTPTRAALMTGRYPTHLGMQHSVLHPQEPRGLPLDEITLPEILREYNYSTHAVGKWHLGFYKWAYTPLYRGFDDFFGFYLGGQHYFTHEWYGGGFDLREDYWNEKGEFVDEIRYDLKGQYSAEIYSQRTVDLIHKLKSHERPFFIYLAHHSVHLPNEVPQRYIDMYTQHLQDPERKVFAAMVSAMDEGVGNITKALAETGLDQNTIIVFTSDNGAKVNCVQDKVYSTSYPLRGGKRSLYEGGIMTAAFVWAKNLLKSGAWNGLMHVTDWLPTLWGLASNQGQLEPRHPIRTKPLDGLDQWESISNNIPSKRSEFLVNIDPLPTKCGIQVPNGAVRWRDWKLILGAGGPPSSWAPAPGVAAGVCEDGNPDYIELYNVIEDPMEVHNVSALHPDIVELLTGKIRGYNATALPPANLPPDPASNPKHFNNTWMPWGDVQPYPTFNLTEM